MARAVAMAKATELKALEEHLLTDCATARERLAPVEKAIALKAKATARHDKAVAEGDGGAALMKAAFEAVPASMPARYPQESDALLQLQLPVLAGMQRGKVDVFRFMFRRFASLNATREWCKWCYRWCVRSVFD